MNNVRVPVLVMPPLPLTLPFIVSAPGEARMSSAAPALMGALMMLPVPLASAPARTPELPLSSAPLVRLIVPGPLTVMPPSPLLLLVLSWSKPGESTSELTVMPPAGTLYDVGAAVSVVSMSVSKPERRRRLVVGPAPVNVLSTYSTPPGALTGVRPLGPYVNSSVNGDSMPWDNWGLLWP